MYNIMTGEGFDTAFMGNWSMAMFMIPVLFFLTVFVNKFMEDYGWNRLFSFIGVTIGYLVLVSIFGDYRLAFAGGVVGLILGGYFGQFFGGE